MQSNIKKSLDKITVSDEIKSNIYEDILKKASGPRELPKKKNYMPVVLAAACMVMGFFAFPYLFPQTEPEPVLLIRNIDIEPVVGSNYEVYFFVEDVLVKQVFSAEEATALSVWDKAREIDSNMNDIELIDFSYENNVLSLNFNQELQNKADENIIIAIVKSMQSVYLDVQEINISSNSNPLTLDGNILSSEYYMEKLNYIQ